jgi:hypothetical protein
MEVGAHARIDLFSVAGFEEIMGLGCFRNADQREGAWEIINSRARASSGQLADSQSVGHENSTI